MAQRLVLVLSMMSAVCLSAQTLRITTFNVRYPSPEDGPNKWELRRDLFAATVRDNAPAVMGTQELFYEQGQYLVDKAPGYTWFGVSREGDHSGEHMGVFYRSSLLRLVESGNFWLSETPEVPASMSWGVSLPRMVTWGLFEIKTTGRRFYLYNTHFPHRDEDAGARLRCARVIRERIDRLPKSIPVILIGDFNAPARGDAYEVLAGSLSDAWEKAAKRSGPEGTFNGFRGETGGPRIDWILFRGGMKVLRAETITRNDHGRYPSDHFAVSADFEF